MGVPEPLELPRSLPSLLHREPDHDSEGGRHDPACHSWSCSEVGEEEPDDSSVREGRDVEFEVENKVVEREDVERGEKGRKRSSVRESRRGFGDEEIQRTNVLVAMASLAKLTISGDRNSMLKVSVRKQERMKTAYETRYFKREPTHARRCARSTKERCSKRPVCER